MSYATHARAQTSAETAASLTLAAAWYAHLQGSLATRTPHEVAVPDQPAANLAALIALILGGGKTVLILVPDDEPLPALSSALDLHLRPLCLVLPSADFAARIALRATLSLLKSRLARDSDEQQDSAWTQQRERIADTGELWRDAQTWNAKNDRSPWPEDVANLFPARILPLAAYRALPRQDADFTVFYRCGSELDCAQFPGRQLMVGRREATPTHRALTIADESTRLSLELAQLTQEIGELELELATAQGEMLDFTRRYYELVGRRMSELDALQARLAKSQASAKPQDEALLREAERLKAQAETSARESRRFAEAEQSQGEMPRENASGFRPDQHVKRLFRQLAQKIHPDRACDEADRAWRTQLMSEANRAYRAGNAAGLHEVAALWEEGLTAGKRDGQVPASSQNVLQLQLTRMRQRFAAIKLELNHLFGSRLYELFLAARQGWREGRDLLLEMANALDDKIEQARLGLAQLTTDID